VPLKKGYVFCQAYGGLQYSCNPKYISEKILGLYSNHFKLIWSFSEPETVLGVDNRIMKVKRLSLKELLYINTSEFLISNIRFNDFGWGWQKRPNQKYIMTWHGSMGVKPIEFDVEDRLSKTYVKKAQRDSLNIDLMLSDSKWCTELCRRAFRYKGEILEIGLPRNDIFFQMEKIMDARKKVLQFYHIKEDKKVLLYAPTFRVDKSLDNYISHWDMLINALKARFNEDFVIMIRLHPNMMKVVKPSKLMTCNDMLDVTQYSDMQELLCASDILITDYSSSMFEFALMNKPCFLYMADAETYDRGLYFKLEELPFPLAYDLNSLANKIQVFDETKYMDDLTHFFIYTFERFQQLDSSAEVVKWMLERSLK
jgi:CDP-glycerol glycerophosphotransferase